MYLLQLVQALRYENYEEIITGIDDIKSRRDSVGPGDFGDIPDRERSVSTLSRASSHDSILDALGGASTKPTESPETRFEKEV